MKRAQVLASILLLSTIALCQTSSNPQDRTANPTDQTYNTRPVETGRSWGGWGLLGLFGLAGLLGRRRDVGTTSYTRDDRTYGQQQRRVG